MFLDFRNDMVPKMYMFVKNNAQIPNSVSFRQNYIFDGISDINHISFTSIGNHQLQHIQRAPSR